MNDAGAEPLYWVIGPDRRTYGPLPADTLRAWRLDRRIGSESPACQDGDTEWRTLRDFPELFRPPLPPAPQTAAPPTLPSLSIRDAELAIPNHLVAALLLSMIGCPPLGLVAVYYSHQVGARIKRGDIDGAWRASARARVWCWITFLLGFPAWVLALTGFSRWLGLS